MGNVTHISVCCCFGLLTEDDFSIELKCVLSIMIGVKFLYFLFNIYVVGDMSDPLESIIWLVFA